MTASLPNPLFTKIIVSGRDAHAFLQGQLTCDLDTLTNERPLLACINSAQGRVQAVLDIDLHLRPQYVLS